MSSSRDTIASVCSLSFSGVFPCRERELRSIYIRDARRDPYPSAIPLGNGSRRLDSPWDRRSNLSTGAVAGLLPGLRFPYSMLSRDRARWLIWGFGAIDHVSRTLWLCSQVFLGQYIYSHPGNSNDWCASSRSRPILAIQRLETSILPP